MPKLRQLERALHNPLALVHALLRPRVTARHAQVPRARLPNLLFHAGSQPAA